MALIAAALSAGVVFGEIYAARAKKLMIGLIPPVAIAVIAYIVLIALIAGHRPALTVLFTFYMLQIPVITGVVAFVLIRTRHRRRQTDENLKQIKLQNARRIENEKQQRLNTLLNGFRCTESSMKLEGQREIVILSRSGHTNEEIAASTGASIPEIEQILGSFERYCNRVDIDDTNTTDKILTPEQEESIVNYLVNSNPAENKLSGSFLWNKGTARIMASNLLGQNISSRMIGAYMAHWGLTVPEEQTIRYRSNQPEVRMWLAGEFERIRSLAAQKGGEIIWIYTVNPEKLADISVSIPKNPVMLCAVSADGSLAFRVYDKDVPGYFTDFVAALTSSNSKKFYAIINEEYEFYMDTLGRDRRKAVSSKIEFFEAV